MTARAGLLTLLYGTSLEKRSTIRRMLNEAGVGQRLPTRITPPTEPELVDSEDELEAESAEDEDEDHEGPLEPETPVHVSVSQAGIESLRMVNAVERWLRNAPNGGLQIRYRDSAKGLLPVACAWNSTIAHALAGKPLTLSEVQEAVPTLAAEAVSDYLGTMVKVGLAEIRRDRDGEERFAVTQWMREVIGPLAVAVQYEHRRPNLRGTPPDELDIAAGFQLILPNLKLPVTLEGSCRLGVETGAAGPPKLSGATAQVAGGRVISASPELDPEAGSWAIGSLDAWLETLIEPDVLRVRTGGDTRLARSIVSGLTETVFGNPGRPHSS